MAAELLSDLSRATDSNSDPLSGAQLFFYATGTLNPQATYTTAALSVAHANPVVADSGGLFPPIFLNSALQYRRILKTAAGVIIQDTDPVNNGVDPGGRFDAIELKLSELPTPRDVGITLPTDSQAIGTEALKSLTTGIRNTGFGYQALKANTDASENTAFGFQALKSVTGGVSPEADFNTGFGSFALASVTTGYKNTAIGRATADNLTTGYHDTALGYGAMHWATTAVNCVGVGFEAIHGGDGTAPALTAQGLVGIGFQALYDCRTGDFNTAVGTSAGRNVTTGARNTGVGTNALNQITTASDNTSIGYAAGLNNTGSGNIFIGSAADANAGRANVTVIGTGLTATADNTMLLGNGQTVIPGSTAADLGTQANPWGFVISNKAVYAHSGTAPPAGGTTGAGFLISSTANFGIFFGSGAPTMSAARGSLYLRTDGSATNNRLYVNADNGTGWTAVTTAT